jgi:hypothetical protein
VKVSGRGGAGPDLVSLNNRRPTRPRNSGNQLNRRPIVADETDACGERQVTSSGMEVGLPSLPPIGATSKAVVD